GRIAVDRHAGAVRPAVGELEQHLAQMGAEVLAHVERLREKARYSTHGRTFECRQARVPNPWLSRTFLRSQRCTRATWPEDLRAGSLRLQMTDQTFTAPESLDDVRKYIDDNGIEFLFAQFVDMHG